MTDKAIAYWEGQGTAAAQRTADAIKQHMDGKPATRQTMLAIRKGDMKGEDVKPKKSKATTAKDKPATKGKDKKK